jgi:hypothetical protein
VASRAAPLSRVTLNDPIPAGRVCPVRDPRTVSGRFPLTSPWPACLRPARSAVLRRPASQAATRPAATAAKRGSHDRLSFRPAARARCSISSISPRACWCASADAAGFLSAAAAVSGSFLTSLALPAGLRRNGCRA